MALAPASAAAAAEPRLEPREEEVEVEEELELLEDAVAEADVAFALLSGAFADPAPGALNEEETEYCGSLLSPLPICFRHGGQTNFVMAWASCTVIFTHRAWNQSSHKSHPIMNFFGS